MKVLLINPASPFAIKAPPLGLLYVAAYLRDHFREAEVRVVDANFYNMTNSELLKEVRDFRPDLAGIYSVAANCSVVHELAGFLRNHVPYIVLGGPYATTYYEKALEDENWDAIRKDLDKLPIEGISRDNSEAEILDILSKHGVRKRNGDVEVEIWGSGRPMREFLWSEDMADACVHLMETIDFKDTYDPNDKEIRNTHINIGTGKEISIRKLAELVKKQIGFKGGLYFNTDKPNGTMRKLTDVSKLHHLGWHHKLDIEEGVGKLYDWYLTSIPY